MVIPQNCVEYELECLCGGKKSMKKNSKGAGGDGQGNYFPIGTPNFVTSM